MTPITASARKLTRFSVTHREYVISDPSASRRPVLSYPTHGPLPRSLWSANHGVAYDISRDAPAPLAGEPASRFDPVAIEPDPWLEPPGPETRCLFSSKASLLSSSSGSRGGCPSTKLSDRGKSSAATTQTDARALPRQARIDYGRLIAVSHGVKVLFVGTVAPADWQVVRNAAGLCWAETDLRLRGQRAAPPAETSTKRRGHA